MDTTPAGRLRFEGRQDKPGHPHHKDEPQNYKGNNADSARTGASQTGSTRSIMHIAGGHARSKEDRSLAR